MIDLISIVMAAEPELRNQSLEGACASLSPEELLKQCDALDAFRRRSENLYERVRALFFLYAIHRFHLPAKLNEASRFTLHASRSLIPFKGYEHLLQRRFEEAIDHFLAVQQAEGPSDAISSALAAAYHRLGFQTLADQVRRSVRSVRGNQWMFRMGHPADHPLRLRPELLARHPGDGTYPILRECTPVRMDLTHCGWSDIFFLGMDFPEGAKVLNVSIDLGIHGRDAEPRPPVEAYLRVIEEPLLRLVSVDLGATADITNLAEVFDFAKDYLGLLKASVIAAGIVPPGIEGSGQSLAELLARVVGPGRGLEIASSVNDIPKGSRLAVSTTLLAALVSVCMRATGQAASLTGQLQEHERRLVLARALLGEWLGGSGGGWQDSGGVWPGMKLIEGVLATEGDPESGVSRGRLMPQHRILDKTDASPETRRKLQESLVLVHGGMAQNVGPILEMVTEKYLLRCDAEWKARQSMLGILNEILDALKREDVRAIGAATTRNFRQPIQSIIPWATNYFTETLIGRVREEFGEAFWGFWMLGGMSGGGMGFIFAPEQKARAQGRLQEIMSATKRELQAALPFAMEPVVYDFAINERGTFADLLEGEAALMPPGYYTLTAPALLRQDRHSLSPLRRAELDKFGAACRSRPELRGVVQTLFDVMLPRGKGESAADQSLTALLEQHGFDRLQHEQIRTDLKEGRIGLAQNRLPASAVIENVQEGDLVDATAWLPGQACGSQSSGAGVPPVVPGVSPSLTTSERELRGRDPLVAGETPAPLQPLPFKAFEKGRPASISSRRLPHWCQEGATYFVTFRLKDALPQAVVHRLQGERENWLRRHPEPHTREQIDELNDLCFGRLDKELDRGYGESVLKETLVADIVESALHHFDGERYWLGTYAIMPNHVHALVRPVMQHKLPDILHSWKSFASHAIGKARGRTGTFWQDESFDHIVRDERQLERFGLYIAENPGKAHLAPGTFRLGGGLATRQEASGAGVPPAVRASRPRSTSPDAVTAGETPAVTGGTPAPLQPSPGPELRELGLRALKNGELAVVTLAAGAGSRWTQGAGVVKALHPFCKLAGHHRTFMETHLAKSRRISRQAGTPIPHIFTTSYLTHAPTEEFLARQDHYGYEGPLFLSPGKSVGLRMIPTVRDLRFVWEEMPQQILDEQQQKVRDSLRHALINWARSAGEASDYTDNLPLQCLHPVGHWYEVPNLLRNGVLARLLAERPQLKHLTLHNIDTLGADADPAVLGWHIRSGTCLSFEVITRRLEDRGGGLARVNGRVRLVEGLAMPREEAEFALSYYNSNTCWIDLDKLLAAFALTRADLGDEAKVAAAIRHLAAKMPTYITLKEVKKRWGHGQEDIFPVTQFEKLWVDMTALPEVESRFIVVPRLRGQQLKDQAQLDGWLRDGSAAYVESLCEYQD
jgi:REP element-mobilizing transposase RayT/galactokinase/mevalonate kinase-like predicted kinase